MPLTWCDKLASTPAAGFGLEPYLMPSSSIQAALAPLLNKLVDGDQIQFTLNRSSPFGFDFTTNDGFNYGIDHQKVFVEFTHQMKIKPKSAGPPIAELTSTPLPFSTLLPEILRRLIEATLRLPGIGNRKVKWVGIVSTTALDESVMPPGIARLIKYIGRPWQGKLQTYHIEIASELRRDSGSFDKCIHILRKVDNPDQLPFIRFDWQRWFDPGRAAHADTLPELLGEAEKPAMAYFEELAEGNRFDEDILRATT
jgi:hypothetical protein